MNTANGTTADFSMLLEEGYRLLVVSYRLREALVEQYTSLTEYRLLITDNS